MSYDPVKLRTGSCRHFRGSQHETCLAGVAMRALVGGPEYGWMRRLPCVGPNNPLRDPEPVHCAQFSGMSEEEARAEVEEMMKAADAVFGKVPR